MVAGVGPGVGATVDGVCGGALTRWAGAVVEVAEVAGEG
jgi:hypothetical protein